MAEHIFDPEQFVSLINQLRKLGVVHHEMNERVRDAHNNLYFAGVESLGDPIPDTAPVSNYEQVGSAVLEFIRTIPGIDTSGMAEMIKRQDSLMLSDSAVSARLRWQNGGEVGMSLTFASDNYPHHVLRFDKTDPQHTYARVEIKTDLNGRPEGGNVLVGHTDTAHLNIIYPETTIFFDKDGTTISDSEKYGITAGDHLNGVKLIGQITSNINLDQPTDVAAILKSAVTPLLQ